MKLNTKKIISKIPKPIVGLLPSDLDCWLVGGGARYVVGVSITEPKDYDIILPSNAAIACVIRRCYERSISVGGTTTFGGSRIIVEGHSLDFWEDDIGKFLSQVPVSTDGLAVHLGSGCIIMTSEFAEDIKAPIASRFVRRTSKVGKHIEGSINSIK